MASSKIDVSMVFNFGTSSSATNTSIFSHGIASANCKTMSSTIITGMQLNIIASTNLRLQRVHPSGYTQNTATACP